MPRLIRLYNPVAQGFVNVPPEEATGLLQQGFQLTTSEPLALRNSHGESFGASGNEVYKAVMEGSRFETEAEEHDRFLKANYSGVGATLAAGAFGAVNSATMGAAAAIGRNLGYRETLADLTEASPVATTVGEVAGVVVPAVLSGGESLLAHGARALPAARAAMIGENLAGKFAANLAGATQLTKGAVVLGRAGAQAIEGAVFGGAQALSEDLLGDPNLTTQKMLAHVATGAAAGAAIDGVLGFALGGLAARSLDQQAAHVANKLTPTAERLTQAQLELAEQIHGRPFTTTEGGELQNMVKEWLFKSSLKASGVSDPQTADHLSRLATDDFLRQLSDRQGDAERFARDITPVWSKLVKKTNEFLYGVSIEGTSARGVPWSERVRRTSEAVPDMPPVEAFEAFQRPIQGVMGILRDVRTGMEARGSKAAVADIDDLIREESGYFDLAFKRMATDAVELPSNQQGQAAFRHLSEVASDYRRKVDDILSRPQWREASQEIESQLRNSRQVLLEGLHDENIFGEAARKSFRYRETAAKTLSHQPILDSLFTKVQQEAGRTRNKSASIYYELDGPKVQALGTQIARGEAGSVRVKGIRDQITDQQDELRAIAEELDLRPHEAKFVAEIREEWAKFSDRMAVWDETLQAGDLKRQVQKFTSQGGFGPASLAFTAGKVAQSVSPFLFFSGTTGPAGAVAGYIGGNIAATLAQPMKFLARLSQVHDASKTVTAAVRKAAKGIVGTPATDGTVRAGRRARAGLRGAAVGHVGAEKGRQLGEWLEGQETLRTLSQLRANPDQTRKMLTERFPLEMRQGMPKVVAAAVNTQFKAIDYVLAEAGRLRLLASRSMKPRPEAWAEWKARLRAANDPMGEVITPAGAGLVSKAGVETLKAIHPQLFQEWVGAIWDEIQTAQLHGPVARRLSVALDIPFDAFSAPDMVRMFQNTRSVLAPDAGGQGGSGRPPVASSATRLRDIQDSNLSASQRLLT